MPKNTQCSEFLQSLDQYAQPIQLTYKQQKQFPTACGGVMTILHGIVFCFFFVIVAFNLLTVSFNISSYQSSNVSGDLERPIYYFGSNSMITAMDVVNYHVDPDTLFNYLGMYFEQTNGLTGESVKYNVTYCKNVVSEELIQLSFGDAGLYYYCPDMPNGKAISLGGYVTSSSNFNFYLGTCDAMKSITGATDCKTEDKTLEKLPFSAVSFYLATYIPNGYSYTNNQVNASYEMTSFTNYLSNTSSFEQVVYMEPIFVTYMYNWFYSARQTAEQHLTRFALIAPTNQKLLKTDQAYKYQFLLTNNIQIETWQRTSFMSLIGELGGITSILVFVIGGFVQQWSNFSIDNSMITNLYTIPKKKSDQQLSQQTNSLNREGWEKLINEGKKQKYNILTRNKFIYNTTLALIDYFRVNCCCCFCNKCCCKISKENQIFHEAQNRLYGEMDIVKLMKLVRFTKFLSSDLLRPIHWKMVPNFDSYCVNLSSESEKTSDQSSSEEISDDEKQITEAVDQLSSHKLAWYFKPKHQVKLTRNLYTSKLNDAQKEKLEIWLDKVKMLAEMNLYKQEFQEDLEAGNEQGFVKKLDIIALKLLMGKSKVNDYTVQQSLEEALEETQVIEQFIDNFLKSDEGKELIQKIGGPKVT